MAPIAKRYFGSYHRCYDGDCNSGWYNWGRWVLFGVIVGVAVLVLLAMLFARKTSRNRVEHGQQPVAGTAWMLPPRYRQTDQYPPPPAPPYQNNQDGFHDENGNFVSKAQAAQTPLPAEQADWEYPAGHPGGHPYDVAPPPGPPPGRY